MHEKSRSSVSVVFTKGCQIHAISIVLCTLGPAVGSVHILGAL